MSKKEPDIRDIQRVIKSCDAKHWPNILSWADELKSQQSRSIVESLVLCYIELEAQKRGDTNGNNT